MKLSLSNTRDGYMLWSVTLKGRHNDGDGGIDIYQEWFMIARSEQEVRAALETTVETERHRYRWYSDTCSIEYGPVSAMDLVICSRRPGPGGQTGRLVPIKLTGKSKPGISIVPTLMDTRS